MTLPATEGVWREVSLPVDTVVLTLASQHVYVGTADCPRGLLIGCVLALAVVAGQGRWLRSMSTSAPQTVPEGFLSDVSSPSLSLLDNV